jgi:hypothetical protein
MAKKWEKSFYKIKFIGQSDYGTPTKVEITQPTSANRVTLNGLIVRRFVKEALSYSSSIQKANEEDARTISKWLKDSDVNMRTIDPVEVTSMFISKRSHFKTKAGLIRKYGVPLTFIGPFTSGFQAYCRLPSFGNRWLYKLLQKYKPTRWIKCRKRKDFFSDKNGRRLNGKQLLATMRERLKSRGDGFVVGKGANRNTLFLTKLILTELVDNRLRKIDDAKKRRRKRLAFWNELKFRSNYFEYNRAKDETDRDFIGSRSYHEARLYGRRAMPDRKPFPFKLDPNYMIAHAGYEYGGSIEGYKALHEYIKKKYASPKGHLKDYLSRKSERDSGIVRATCGLGGDSFALGVDCSGFIQKAIVGMSSYLAGLVKKRLSTKNMSKELKCKDGRRIASRTSFFCEARLSPGSIVVGHGHTYIFLGYGQDPREVRKLGLDKAPYRMMTMEAEGNFARSVGIFFRHMPYEKKRKSICRRYGFSILKLNPAAMW